MWLIKIKGKAKIPDYLQLRDGKMILLDYFRADRPLEKFKKHGILKTWHLSSNHLYKTMNQYPKKM